MNEMGRIDAWRERNLKRYGLTLAEYDEMSLAEWLRGQITLAYFVRYEQQVIGESLKPVDTTEKH